MSKKKILELIDKYAEVYQLFENFQKYKDNKPGLLPLGDQKTGVIGEYYAKCYLESLDGVSEVEYAKSGNSADITYRKKGHAETIKVQVKCVSHHSQTKTIAPLTLYNDVNKSQPAFDYLYLIALDDNFKPIGFYINAFSDLKLENQDKNRLVGLKMAFRNKTGSKRLNFSNNRFLELKAVIGID